MSTVAYLVRHGEVEHHRSDIAITARGREQAASAAGALADRIAEGDTVLVCHAPVNRVRETAEIVYARLLARRIPRVNLRPPQIDLALSNVRFTFRSDDGDRLEEPSQLYEEINDPAYLKNIPQAWVDFYGGFWKSADPMGYWLTHDSGGGAETPASVLCRFQERLKTIVDADGVGRTRTHSILVTHSGAMRAVLRHAFGSDLGEPEFCGIITVEQSAQTLQPTLTYLGQSASLNLADR